MSDWDESPTARRYRGNRPAIPNQFESVEELRAERDEYRTLWERTGSKDERRMYALRSILVIQQSAALGDYKTFNDRLRRCIDKATSELFVVSPREIVWNSRRG